MARRKTGDHWRERAREIYQNAPEPKPGSKRVADQLERDYPSDETGPPGERVVRNYLHEFRLLAAAAQREYEYFTWPGSMVAELLPWEASRDLLDLAKYRRVLIPFARWYWRACLAMPDAPIGERFRVAGVLAARSQLAPHAEEAASLQAYLSIAAWRPGGREEYDKAVEAGRFQRWEGMLRDVPEGKVGEMASLVTGGLSTWAMGAIEEVVRGEHREGKRTKERKAK